MLKTIKLKKRALYACLTTLILLTATAVNTLAQQPHREIIKQLISSVNGFNAKQAGEKLYLQTDKPTYAPGDTLRIKAYLLEAPYLDGVEKSGILYVELANDSNRLIRRTMLPVYRGITFSNIVLNDREFPQGGYIIRAYTNWMRNFGENGIFTRHFYVGQPANTDWLINYHASTSKDTEKEKVALSLKFSQLDMVPVALREMQLRLTNGKRTLLKSDINTDMEGGAAVNFDLPGKANLKDMGIAIQDKRKGEGNRTLVMPLILNRPQQTDIQFMAEGGSLVAGLRTRIAFKAVNEDGYGADVAGKVYNSKRQEVTTFRSNHKGMGAFEMMPQASEIYTARITFNDGSYKDYTLPSVSTSGIALRVNNNLNSDSVEVMVSATPDIADAGSAYYLMAHIRGLVCYGALARFKSGVCRLAVSKSAFPTGVVRFTLIGADKKALNERMIYVDHKDALNIHVDDNKQVYGKRENVSLNVTVTDADGAPVQGSFSMAVTDDGQVKADSLTGNIVTSMLLTTELKGFVEEPGYYLNSIANAQKWLHLDQLLLTQGWVGFNWDDALFPAKPLSFAAEKEYLVTGRVLNAFNKPVVKSGVTLFSKKPVILLDTLSNERGAFTFKGILPADTAVYFIQAKNKKGKSFNVGIEIDEFTPPVFSITYPVLKPWYMNIDTSRLANLKQQVALKQYSELQTSGRRLKEVVIKSKRIVRQSKNLNGPGEADVVIDEEELQKAGKATLGDLLRKNVKGFLLKSKAGVPFYYVYTSLVHVIIDGIDTEAFKPDSMPLYQYFNEYFDYYNAEDIKGIEVMANPSHATRYVTRFLDPMASPTAHAFIEVTTRSGHGPFVKKTAGTYVYRPMPFTLPQQFYAPKYAPNSIPNMTDIRSTIHWEPNLITGSDGKATVSFYTADIPGKYTVLIEGADLKGSIGTKRSSITVKK